jgi:hypothetical protein
MPQAGIEPATPTSEESETHALDATGIGCYKLFSIRSGALKVNVLLGTSID